MNYRKVLFFLFIYLSSHTINLGYAQSLNKYQDSIIRKDIAYYIFEDAYLFPLNMQDFHFSIIKKDTLFNPSGFHLLYKINNGRVTRLDKSRFHGHNYGRIMYNHDGNIYLLGGYGFFQSNNLLEKFNVNSKEWTYVSTKGDKPGFIFGIQYKKDSIIYCFNSVKMGNGVEDDVLDSNYYTLNINTRTWNKYKNYNSSFSNIPFGMCIYLKNYSIGISKKSILIINKSSLKYLILNNSEIPINSSAFNLLGTKGDILIHKFTGTLQDNKSIQYLNIDSLFNSPTSHPKDLIVEQNMPETKYLIFGAVLIFILTFLYLMNKYFRKRKSLKYQFKQAEVNPIVNQLLNKITTDLTVEELDIIFNIDYMEAESKKSKRHRIISNLEQEYPGLITRLKDETDKRKFVYHIDKQIYK